MGPFLFPSTHPYPHPVHLEQWSLLGTVLPLSSFSKVWRNARSSHLGVKNCWHLERRGQGGAVQHLTMHTPSSPLTSKNFPAQNVNTPEFEKLCPSPLTLKIDYVQMVSSCSIQVLNSPLGFQSALHHWFLS